MIPSISLEITVLLLGIFLLLTESFSKTTAAAPFGMVQAGA